ncbi:MAG TPA: 2,3-diphosphoglycerate synthetase [Actinomycetota bacterium]|jgi:cyclic 2,3-diphosphoglycerate synthetase
MKVIALVDGEHYPSVTRWGLDSARQAGLEVILALLVGGIEKLGADRGLDLGSVPVVRGEADPRAALSAAIREHSPEAVLDLSDEPVLGYEHRMELAAVALSMGVPYLGPDFRFDPPIVEAPLPVPTLGVIGAGKRVAKTAIAGHAARLAVGAGLRPAVVAMGRGGPVAPVTAGAADVTLDALLATAERGEHAASDYLEDALMSGVPTVGARRCGGGLAGKPFVTNVAEAAQQAAGSGADLVILEGSGASVPTVPWDAGILVAPATTPLEHLGGYFGPLRILLSDLLVFIMDGGSSAEPDNLSSLYPLVRRLHADIRVAIAELQPVALADVRGKDAFFATTAHRELAGHLADRLERTSGCRVVKVSPHLADRAALEADLAEAPPFDVLLTELKAAAIDVAARRALDRGAEVVFVDNRPRTAGGDGEIDELLTETILLAGERGRERTQSAEPE